MIAPIAVVGPSGVGKDFLMSHAALMRADLHLVRRVITRPAHAGGEDFQSVSEAEFERRLQADEFALHWRAHGLAYAIPKSELTARPLMNLSRSVLHVAHGLWPNLLVINVTAPAEILAQRLAQRGRETALDQAARLSRAGLALPQGLHLREVCNDASPELGLARFLAAINHEGESGEFH